MKIAVISDIHGNHYALKSVLDDCKKNEIELIFVLGDVVGYYYHPELVLEMLKDWNCEFIKGNHEQILEDIIEGKTDPSIIKNKYGSGHEMAIKNLSKKQLDFLLNLKTKKVLKYDNLTFELNHTAPWDNVTYIYPNSDEEILNRCFISECDYILIGHSHYMFSFKKDSKTLINCGSVGQSRLNGGVANWVKIDTLNNQFENKNVTYSTSLLLQELEQFEKPDSYLIKILKRSVL